MRNWANVSFAEFEAVVADLLGAHLDMSFERFTAGPDGGIDLRHVSGQRGKPDIVQCKHYQKGSFSQVLRAAQQELPSLQAMQPASRSYRLVTSVGLTPANKSRIRETLSPYIAADSHVYGLDDLEGLLDEHPDVERRHIKLWLANGPQLEALLRPGISRRSRSLADAIQRALPLYAHTDAFVEAWKVLQDRHTCLIAGPPGIGKTTLAHMLVAHAIGLGYDPIEISSNVDEAWDTLDTRSRQIFLYDDFLGHTTLGSLAKNEDHRLLRFIKTLADASHSLLVMTTREYILREASQRYEAFRRAGLQADRLVLGLEALTPLDRARILYNHVWHAPALDRAALESLASEQGYRRIIEHRAFNPRVIEFVTGHHGAPAASLDDWLAYAVDQLDHPTEIWRTAYEELGPAPRALLRTLATFPSAVLYDDLRAAFDAVAADLDLPDDDRDLAAALRIVDDSFVATRRPDGETLLIDTLDPGVRDFLEQELISRPDRLPRATAAAVGFDQLAFLWDLAARHKRQREIGGAFVSGLPRVWDTPSSAFVWQAGDDGVADQLEREPPSAELRLVRLIAIARTEAAPPGLTELLEARLGAMLTPWRDGALDPSATIALIGQLADDRRPASPPGWAAALKDGLTMDSWHVAYWQALAVLHGSAPGAFGAGEWATLTADFSRFADRALAEAHEEDYLDELESCAEAFGVGLDERALLSAHGRMFDRAFERTLDEPGGMPVYPGFGREAEVIRSEIDALFRRLIE